MGRMPAAERRAQLLEVALRTFSESGYHGATMNDLAVTAGVTKPVLYQHFGSKLDLYRELLDSVAASLGTAIQEAVSQAEEGRAQIEAGLLAYFSFVHNNRREFRLLFGSRAQATEDFAPALRNVERSITASIAQLVDASVGAERAERVATAIVAMAEGACRHWLSREPDLDPGILASELATLLWSGMKPA